MFDGHANFLIRVAVVDLNGVVVVVVVVVAMFHSFVHRAVVDGHHLVVVQLNFDDVVLFFRVLASALNLVDVFDPHLIC